MFSLKAGDPVMRDPILSFFFMLHSLHTIQQGGRRTDKQAGGHGQVSWRCCLEVVFSGVPHGSIVLEHCQRPHHSLEFAGEKSTLASWGSGLKTMCHDDDDSGPLRKPAGSGASGGNWVLPGLPRSNASQSPESVPWDQLPEADFDVLTTVGGKK
ncbi:hypothetical protein VTK56DRAFT_8299 [Thermocarpiscus australiensis]